MLDDRQYADFVSALKELNPVDAADFFSELDTKRIPAIFKLIPKDNSAEIFAELDADIQKRIVEAMTDKELEEKIAQLAPELHKA